MMLNSFTAIRWKFVRLVDINNHKSFSVIREILQLYFLKEGLSLLWNDLRRYYLVSATSYWQKTIALTF